MQEKLLTFLLNMKKIIRQIVCNHPVALDRLLNKMVYRKENSILNNIFLEEFVAMVSVVMNSLAFVLLPLV